MTGDGYGAVVMLSETSSFCLIALLAPLLGSGGG
jgi:adenosylcobinamide-GDP ribazoletransferase